MAWMLMRSVAEACTVCTDMPNQFMIDSGKTCASWTWGLNNNCNKKTDWAAARYCQLSCFEAGHGYAGDDCCPTWSTVRVSPPPASCSTDWTDAATCNPLQHAVDSAAARVVIDVEPGVYFNKAWGTGARNNDWLLLIKNKKHVVVQASTSELPHLKFDGRGGIKIQDSENVTIKGLEVSGPANRITGVEASLNRKRLTSRGADGSTSGVCGTDECSSCSAADCSATEFCGWDDARDEPKCRPQALSYYSGIGIHIGTTSSNIREATVKACRVHHCPGSGIRADRADDVLIEDNVVYDNVWWTPSAMSGIVFAESQGDGINMLRGNAVYGNRNFMPFYLDDLAKVTGGSQVTKTYAKWNQSYIIDGSGLYLTRNQDYQGSIILDGNVAFDNGINGLVVHKTNHANVSVDVIDNVIFDNGKTTRDVEGRQNAGGLVINSGNDVMLTGNKVWTSVQADFTYQCYGSCVVDSDSKNNEHCVGKLSSSYPTSMFATAGDCDSSNVEHCLHHHNAHDDNNRGLNDFSGRFSLHDDACCYYDARSVNPDDHDNESTLRC
eukprot:TRINITY_DN10887_c0_g2_i1.p1 TRINITY_DN10887_c0_g2~~TRINITY_DN10887_c0_g2_i1.p1  ORF type:complete len:587 (-),score=93.54 TRINITY_DN10887_c0_g2_i1:652-2310(-)